MSWGNEFQVCLVGDMSPAPGLLGGSPQQQQQQHTHLVLMYFLDWYGSAQAAWQKPELLRQANFSAKKHKSLGSFRVLGGPFA